MKDFDTMMRVVDRAQRLYAELGIRDDRITIVMDLDNASDSVELDLAGLADAKEGDFAHDVIGIRNHMNRQTGRLEGCFLPRYAKQ